MIDQSIDHCLTVDHEPDAIISGGCEGVFFAIERLNLAFPADGKGVCCDSSIGRAVFPVKVYGLIDSGEFGVCKISVVKVFTDQPIACADRGWRRRIISHRGAKGPSLEILGVPQSARGSGKSCVGVAAYDRPYVNGF